MALQMVLDSLDGVDEGIQPLYIEKEGKFHLDVDGHVKNDEGGIPRQRLNAEIEKRKASDAALEEIAQGFTDEVPEDMRDIIPDLPPAQKIKWIQNATRKGLFSKQAPDGVDTKRPGGKPPQNYDGMSPQAIMARGYKN
jgi:hypothetical protein